MTSGEAPGTDLSTSSDAPGTELSAPPVGLNAWDRSRLPIVPRWLATLGIAAVLLAASAWVIGQQFGSSPASRQGSKHPSPVPSGFTQFKDPAGTFAGSYPSSWRRLQPVQPRSGQNILLVAGPAGSSYLIGKTPIGAVVTASNLAAAKAFTARVVKSGNDVKYLHSPEAVTLGGLPGYLYLYTFVDRATGEQGAHAHYFLFDGKTMITLVFQSLPSTSFLAAAPLFDRIAKTFHVLPAG